MIKLKEKIEINIDSLLHPSKEQLEKEFGTLESYEWKKMDGKKLKVYFYREFNPFTGQSWMSISQAFTVEEIEKEKK